MIPFISHTQQFPTTVDAHVAMRITATQCQKESPELPPKKRNANFLQVYQSNMPITVLTNFDLTMPL